MYSDYIIKYLQSLYELISAKKPKIFKEDLINDLI